MANPGFAKCSANMERWSPEPRRDYYLSIYGPADGQYFALSCGMRHLGMFRNVNDAYAKALTDFSGASSSAEVEALPAGVGAVRVLDAYEAQTNALMPILGEAAAWRRRVVEDLRELAASLSSAPAQEDGA